MSFSCIVQLRLDASKIDMKTLLEEEVDKALVHSVPLIKQALLVKNPDAKDGCNMMLKTNGVNFLVRKYRSHQNTLYNLGILLKCI